MYSAVFTDSFSNDVKSIKKDTVLYSRLKKKVNEILNNPDRYPSKRHNLKGMKGVHVGSFVILFKIDKQNVVFLRFKHHDYAYD